ncbi:uncharacterized protein LOC102702593 [Oryza brachyantha]|uniref:Uncharacterized protein n=1 Tax=Oryza brachyantha TaxID=4533 RepID=J3MW93_ORYBR|nr:uncharacterized protein LOC102702593 [Oryza brachyantha]XP_006660509.1 uncharacterized protein LOC102702593 [Oryza brachyantha]
MLDVTESWMEDSKNASTPESISRYQSSSPRGLGKRNIFYLLAQREISPQSKHQAKKLWSGSPECSTGSVELSFWVADARHDLFSWAESQSLHRWSAKYCPLLPAPRSTIAAAFSLDGRTLASTHGDHTVKIIDCQTGKCLKVLIGHRRTPWVVRYHPLDPDIVASGSLDHEVLLWDTKTSRCIESHFFYKPIASIAFHANGELLAVASGHKLFIWDYNKRDEASNPSMVLRTRRSLRAVQFHPHGAPYLLTAEVNNLDSADSELTHATSSGYSNSPSPFFFAMMNSACCPTSESRFSSACLICPAYVRDDGSICLFRASGSSNVQLPSDSETLQADHMVTPMDVCPGEPGVNNNDDAASTSLSTRTEMHTLSGQNSSTFRNSSAAIDLQRYNARDITQISDLSSNMPNREVPVHSTADVPSTMDLFTTSNTLDALMFLRDVEAGNHHNNSSGGAHSSELPFLQSWLMAQNHTGSRPALPSNEVIGDLPIGGSLISELSDSSRGLSQHYSLHRHLLASVPGGDASSHQGTQNGEDQVNVVSLGVASEFATSLFVGDGAELPCTVKLRIWQHKIENPRVALAPEACCLTISHAVLCSEMGTHFSPCGRFLVACVACLLPQTEVGDHVSQSPVHYDSTGAGTSPTRHPLPSRRVIYELRVYSLEEETFGTVLVSRAIRAAHCLTSIQFSPTSEHILLAYGRRHNSLLRGIFMDGDTTIPVYTVLEVYRVSDMELVRVIPSAEDEVNVACFHPSPGTGLVYGTKEGKLRIIKHNDADSASMGPLTRGNILEIQRH